MKLSWKWLQEYIPETCTVDDAVHSLTMGGLEITAKEKKPEINDVALDSEITSNRPDWLSHIGVAREIAALAGKKISIPKTDIPQKRVKSTALSVEIQDTTLCPYYSAVLLENVSFSETPKVIKDRLAAVNVRSVNLPVDLSNYVLFEYGQPLHVFDFDKMGSRIVVRRAKQHEKFVAINGSEYKLSKNDIAICDERSVLALGGVMGGLHSEVSNTTKNIVLESAYFNPAHIRKTSQYHQLTSDSSYRFERKVDPLGVMSASERFVQLLLKYATIEKVSTLISKGKLPLLKKKIVLPFEFVSDVIGITIPSGKIAVILRNLGLIVEKKTAVSITVSIPSFRSDLTRPVDLVEEIARIYGFSKVPENIPAVRYNQAKPNAELVLEKNIRSACVALGMNEIITFSLINLELYERAELPLAHPVILKNPSNKQLTLMRPSLLPGMLEVLKSNANTGNKDIRLFEVGRVYHSREKSLPDEEKKVGFICCGGAFDNWLDGRRKMTVYDLKGVVETLMSAIGVFDIGTKETSNVYYRNGICVSVAGKEIGSFGILSKKILDSCDIKIEEVFFGECSIAPLKDLRISEPIFKEYGKYPASYRDLAIVVPSGVKAGEIVSTIKEVSKDIITDIRLFDKYEGKQIQKGCKSLAFSIEYQDTQKTLSSEDVEAIHIDIVKSLEQKHGAKLRDI